MALSRTPRRRQQEEEIPESIFDTEAFGGKRQPEKKEPTVKELMERLGQLEARNQEYERERDYESTRPIVVQAPQPQPEIKEPTLDLKGLPDPVAQPEAYAEVIAQRTIKYQNDMQDYRTRKSGAAKPQAGGDFDALWEDFVEKNPAYAENDARTRFAVGEVAKKLAKKGVDMNRYLFTRSERFFKDVTDEYDKVFGKPVTEDDLDLEDRPDQSKGRRSQRASSDDDGDDGRAATILGGGDNPSGTREGPPTPKPGDFIKDLTDMQRKSGYF